MNSAGNYGTSPPDLSTRSFFYTYISSSSDDAMVILHERAGGGDRASWVGGVERRHVFNRIYRGIPHIKSVLLKYPAFNRVGWDGNIALGLGIGLCLFVMRAGLISKTVTVIFTRRMEDSSSKRLALETVPLATFRTFRHCFGPGPSVRPGVIFRSYFYIIT